MPGDSIITRAVLGLLEIFFSVKETKNRELGTPKEIVLILPHLDLGELLTKVSLFRALKESFPDSRISIVINKLNFPGELNIRFINQKFILSKIKLLNPFYFIKSWKFLKKSYDIVIVPPTSFNSHFSNFLAGFCNAQTKIGSSEISGEINLSSFFFDRRINIDWRPHPDSNVAERSLDILRPFGVSTIDYRSELEFEEEELKFTQKFFSQFMGDKENIVGIHVGAAEIQYRWSLIKFCALLNKLNENYSSNFYLIGNKADINAINFVKNNINFSLNFLINGTISTMAAVISKSDLFISNDSEIMHIAGSTSTPQISVFGPTNPFNWAPIGANKYFIRKSELIDDIAVEDVYHLCELILQKKEN
jgi:ADP-heptose:LPS heptosyltransferase